MPLPRLVRLVSSVALFASLPGNAFAEQPAPPRDAQLDRIERKLDDVLKRLGAHDKAALTTILPEDIAAATYGGEVS